MSDESKIKILGVYGAYIAIGLSVYMSSGSRKLNDDLQKEINAMKNIEQKIISIDSTSANYDSLSIFRQQYDSLSSRVDSLRKKRM